MTQDNRVEQGEKISVHVDTDIQELIPVFLEIMSEEIESMQEALERSDYETIQILGHGMGGDGGSYGFDDISDIGRSLEQAAKHRNSEEVRKLVGELSSYLGRVEVIYE